jgi:ABC-type multidrug transport system ATPase subunit
MGWEAVVFFGLVLLIDSPVGGMLYHTIFADKMIDDFGGEIDEDVQAEIQRIKSGKAADDLIRLEGLRKTYSNKVAVNDLYFSIPRGECFGFLGVNGAGKSTTLKMLTGDAKPTRGQAYLNNLNMFEHPEEVRALTGYCPQFDALHSLLTAQETLTFYARLRGVPEKNIPEMIQRMSERLTLTQDNQHLRPCGTYSGGNKRKLSVAIALIGAPPIVFLDEPSTGMDPVSRRFMWDFISETMAGRAVILTTHSMEECEALCQRIGILVHGDLKCIGSSQHLKTRFGKGFQIQMNVEGDVKEASALINKTFDKVDLIESFAGSLKFRCEQTTGISVGQIFTALESGREAARIVDYSVGQTTLEQIFIEFARGEEHAQILEIGDGVDDEELSDSEKEEDDAAPVQRDSAGDLPGTAT